MVNNQEAGGSSPAQATKLPILPRVNFGGSKCPPDIYMISKQVDPSNQRSKNGYWVSRHNTAAKCMVNGLIGLGTVMHILEYDIVSNKCM